MYKLGAKKVIYICTFSTNRAGIDLGPITLQPLLYCILWLCVWGGGGDRMRRTKEGKGCIKCLLDGNHMMDFI